MREFVKIYLLLLITLLFFSFGCDQEKEKLVEVNSLEKIKKYNSDCVELVALWSAGEISKKIGKDKKWVFLNYTVTLWSNPPSEISGTSIGKLRASSYARIIEKRGDDYKVESPINQVQGWINKEHVKTISMKNPKTKALCN